MCYEKGNKKNVPTSIKLIVYKGQFFSKVRPTCRFEICAYYVS